MIKQWNLELAERNKGALPTMTQIHMKCYNNGLDDYVFDLGVNVLKYIGSE
jgi:hypothetical protein